jgi:hypothetical protein
MEADFRVVSLDRLDGLRDPRGGRIIQNLDLGLADPAEEGLGCRDIGLPDIQVIHLFSALFGL